MEHSPMVIDFKEIEGRVLTGRPRGEKLRDKYKLSVVDDEHRPVRVKIPDQVYTLTSSFFLGLFGPSVVAAGTPEEFFRRFNFETNDNLKEAFADYVARALHEKRLFDKAN